MSAIDTTTKTAIVPVPNKKGRVFVRNLSFKNLSEEKIKTLFSQYGQISEVNLPKKETGEMKGFGFVQFLSKNDALVAIKEMNNKKIDGRNILVSLALSKEDYKNPDKNNLNQDEDDEEQVPVKIPKSNKNSKNTEISNLEKNKE